MANEAFGQGPIVGQRLGRYRIIEKIGVGGMGEVYRAHDEHLGRDVAVKVLPPGTIPDDRALKRFHNEAMALSRLNHPNICTIYDVDEHGGQQFIAMELMEGQTLTERIAGRPLRVDELLNLAIQIADALEAAHHRQCPLLGLQAHLAQLYSLLAVERENLIRVSLGETNSRVPGAAEGKRRMN